MIPTALQQFIPTSKVTWAGAAGAAAWVAVWVTNSFLDMVPHIDELTAAALTVIASFGGGYIKNETRPVDQSPPLVVDFEDGDV